MINNNIKKLIKKMRASFIIIFVLIFAFALTACSKKEIIISDEPYFEGDPIVNIEESAVTYEEEDESENGMATNANGDTVGEADVDNDIVGEADAREGVLFTIEKKSIEEKDDKNKYIKINYELINLTDNYFLEDKNIRDAIKKENDDEEEAAKEFDKLLPEVKELFASGEGFPATYEYLSNIRVERMDQQVFSYTKEIYQFLAGAHGTTVLAPFNYSIAKKQKLNFWDVVNISTMIEHLNKKLLPMEADLFPEYKDYIKDKGENFDFLVTDSGVKIIFQQYDIAPYATGIITIEFNMNNEEDREVLNMEYFE